MSDCDFRIGAEEMGSGAFSLPGRFGFLDTRLEELEGLRGLRIVVWVRGIWKSSSSPLSDIVKV